MARYDKTARTWAPHGDKGWVQVTFRAPKRWKNRRYTEQMSTEFDTMPQLAITHYRNPNLYWGIAEMNPEVLCPDDLRPGVTIQLPVGLQ